MNNNTKSPERFACLEKKRERNTKSPRITMRSSNGPLTQVGEFMLEPLVRASVETRLTAGIYPSKPKNTSIAARSCWRARTFSYDATDNYIYRLEGKKRPPDLYGSWLRYGVQYDCRTGRELASQFRQNGLLPEDITSGYNERTVLTTDIERAID